jgi:hypothetical protein
VIVDSHLSMKTHVRKTTSANTALTANWFCARKFSKDFNEDIRHYYRIVSASSV